MKIMKFSRVSRVKIYYFQGQNFTPKSQEFEGCFQGRGKIQGIFKGWWLP